MIRYLIDVLGVLQERNYKLFRRGGLFIIKKNRDTATQFVCLPLLPSGPHGVGHQIADCTRKLLGLKNKQIPIPIKIY